MVDEQGVLWIGTFKGLARYLPEQDQILAVGEGQPFSQLRIRAMIKDAGLLWLATSQGLYQYDLQNGLTRVFVHVAGHTTACPTMMSAVSSKTAPGNCGRQPMAAVWCNIVRKPGIFSTTAIGLRKNTA